MGKGLEGVMKVAPCTPWGACPDDWRAGAGGGAREGEAGLQKVGSPVVSFECAWGELPHHEGSRSH